MSNSVVEHKVNMTEKKLRKQEKQAQQIQYRRERIAKQLQVCDSFFIIFLLFELLIVLYPCLVGEMGSCSSLPPSSGTC